METFNYAFAEKCDRVMCIKYNEQWAVACWEYLYEKKYKLRPASEQHWNRKIDEVGRPCACYLLDRESTEFDVGNY